MNVEIPDEGTCPLCHDPFEPDQEILSVNDRLVHKACHEWRLGRNRTPTDAVGAEASKASGLAAAADNRN